jgi:hypothetical protein
VTMQPNALTISDAAGATLCCNIATVRRVSTNPGLFVVDSHTNYAWWHALCVVTQVDAARARSKRWSPRQSSFSRREDYAVDNPKLHGHAFWLRSHDVYRDPLKAPNVRGFLRAVPHSLLLFVRITALAFIPLFQRFFTSRAPVYRASHHQPCSP